MEDNAKKVLINALKIIETYCSDKPNTYMDNNQYVAECSLTIDVLTCIKIDKETNHAMITIIDNKDYDLSNDKKVLEFINESNKLFKGYSIFFDNAHLTIVRNVGKVNVFNELLSEIITLDGLILNLKSFWRKFNKN